MGKLMGGCRVHKGGVVGWAKDPSGDARVELEASTKEGRQVWSGVADQFRNDLAQKGVGDGNFGFTFQIPSWVFEAGGSGQSLALHIRHKNTDTEIPGSPLKLDEAYWDYRNLLLKMLGLPIFGLVADVARGARHGFFGYALAPKGGKGFGLYMNGKPVSKQPIPQRFDRIITEYQRLLWFVDDYEGLGFFFETDRESALQVESVDNTQVIKIGFGRSASEAMDPLRAVYIPFFTNDEIVVPDAGRRSRVMAMSGGTTNFLALGYSHYRYYREIFERYSGRAWGTIDKVMDWGCGCGRVSQYMIRSLPPGRVLGVDVDNDNVGWCEQNLSGATFMTGPLVPPLNIADESLDYIVATSVFTHIQEELIEPWVAELQRVLKPGGFAALTVASDSRVAWNLRDAEWIAELQRKGVDDTVVSHDLDGHVQQGYYRNVKVTKKYIHDTWGKYFKVHDVLDHVFGYQDVVVCQKK